MTETSTARVRAFRAARQTRTIELPGDVVMALQAIQERDGDASLIAAAIRLIRSAALQTDRSRDGRRRARPADPAVPPS